MKAQELRIGNWLQRLDDSFFQVTSGDIASIEIIPEWLHPKPIPLTPEILEKCGFEKIEYEWYHRKYFTDCFEVAEEMEIVYNVESRRCGVRDFDDDDNP